MTTHDAPTAPPPSSVRRAYGLWLLAVLAGLVETVLAVAQARSEPEQGAAALAVQVGVRLVVFALVVLAARRMLGGSRLAAGFLVLVVGIIGMASLLVGPAEWLLAGPARSELHWSGEQWGFAASRVVHVTAVVGAVVLMLRRSSRRWFAAADAMIGEGRLP